MKLQKRIWGLEDRELYPERIFVVTNKIGGAVLGAFDPQGRPAGFLVYIPAWDEIGRYYYSLALGISAQHQNRGLGRALKLEQRRRALEAGVDRIKWTFDPLRIKNAFFNLSGLGAFSRCYIPDHYGRLSTNQRAGLHTDRLEIEWRLRSARVRRSVGGGKGKVSP
ncbi:MAG: GNAT family N-acetyltransferase, partial [Acidobacteria bacterium]|nr:GNAT family N-acetyltransferase [Acidobacteriota bacterium]